MNAGQATSDRDRRTEFLALAGELRPELHRYCARLMGSVIDGEDVVQDTFARALVALLPNARMEGLAGANHGMLDTHPDAVARLLAT